MAAIIAKETKVYKLAFELAMEIYDLTNMFPKEETYSLTDQIRKSSRSVCICLLEAYRKNSKGFDNLEIQVLFIAYRPLLITYIRNFKTTIKALHGKYH